MAKIEVTPITSGYNVVALNVTLQNIEDEFKNKVVYRDEVSPMERALDMNGEDILNTDTLTVNQIQLGSEVLVEETISELNAARDEAVQSASNAASSAVSALSSENTASSAALSASLSAQAANEIAQFLDGNPALDSSQIVFQQAGAGAVARTVESKLRESVSVKDFGAVGDGVVDDTAAIHVARDALTAMGGGVLVFDAAEYRVTSLVPAHNQKWVGVRGVTRIKILDEAAGGSNCLVWNKSSLAVSLPALSNFSASGIIFDANFKECPAQINGLIDCSFDDCLFINGNSYGFAAQARPGWTNTLDQKRVRFTRCGFENNGNSGGPDYFDGIDVKYGEDWTLTDCWAYDNYDVGFNFRGKNIQLVNCVSSGGVRGFLMQSAEAVGYPSSVQIINAIAEGASSAGVTVQSNTTNSTSVLIANSTATGGTLAGFEVDGSGSSRVTVLGCFSSNNLMGLRLTEASPLSVHVTACVFHGNVYGIRNYGSNLTLSNSTINGNSGYGYAEETGANNNLVLAGNRVYGNAVNFARSGTATAQAVGLSVINDGVLRAFPGYSAGLEFKRDTASGAFVTTVSVGDAASIDYRVNTKGNGQIQGYKDNGDRPLFVFRAAGSASVNYPDFIASLAGSPVLFQATGSDANIDLQLNPKGSSGRVRFGAHTASSDSVVTGYIEVKDAGGTVRRLAVIG